VRLLVLLVIAACGGGTQTCPVAPTPTAPTQPFLWKAQKDSGPIVWLYGTVHNGGEGDVHPAAIKAFEASPRFVSELGDTEPDPKKTTKLAILPPGKGLDQQLPADDWYDLRDTLRGMIKEQDLARVRPWYAMARLSTKLSPPPDPTMDFGLAKRARKAGKQVDALEEWDVQLAALADTVKIPDLQQAIHSRKTFACDLAKMKAVYLTGDLETMTAIVVIPQTHKLVVDRTKAWLPKIEGYFKNDGAFVAVGLAHLAGDEGLPKLLAAAGYTVERVAP
jgi:uncharacterized protein